MKLIVEKSKDGTFWGRVTVGDNLIVEESTSIEELRENLKKTILAFHGVRVKNFTIHYDIQLFFEEFDFLKITNIAKLSGINGSLMRQYATGLKFPSDRQLLKIEKTIHDLGEKMCSARLK